MPKKFVVFKKYYTKSGLRYAPDDGIGVFIPPSKFPQNFKIKMISDIHFYGHHRPPRSKKEHHWKRAALRMDKKIPNKMFSFLTEIY